MIGLQKRSQPCHWSFRSALPCRSQGRQTINLTATNFSSSASADSDVRQSFKATDGKYLNPQPVIIFSPLTLLLLMGVSSPGLCDTSSQLSRMMLYCSILHVLISTVRMGLNCILFSQILLPLDMQNVAN